MSMYEAWNKELSGTLASGTAMWPLFSNELQVGDVLTYGSTQGWVANTHVDAPTAPSQSASQPGNLLQISTSRSTNVTMGAEGKNLPTEVGEVDGSFDFAFGASNAFSFVAASPTYEATADLLNLAKAAHVALMNEGSLKIDLRIVSKVYRCLYGGIFVGSQSTDSSTQVGVSIEPAPGAPGGGLSFSVGTSNGAIYTYQHDCDAPVGVSAYAFESFRFKAIALSRAPGDITLRDIDTDPHLS